MIRFRPVGHTLATAVVMMGALLFIPATPAFAHTELTGSSPAKDSTVTAALTAVTLTFGEPVRGRGATVEVSGSDGVSYSVGAARAVDSNVVQDIRPLPTGPIRVTWRVVASDGDTVEGTFAFTNTFQLPPTVTANPTPTASTPTTSTPTTSAAQSASASSDVGPAASHGGRFLAWTVGVLVAVAIAIGAWLVLRSRR
jgi:methionine-rich copper-binding protein CopC